MMISRVAMTGADLTGRCYRIHRFRSRRRTAQSYPQAYTLTEPELPRLAKAIGIETDIEERTVSDAESCLCFPAGMIRTMKVLKRLPIILVLALSANSTFGAVINGGFETGDFGGWQTAGDASIQTASFSCDPTEGTRQAVLTDATYMTGGPVSNTIHPLSGNVAEILPVFFDLPMDAFKSILEPTSENSAPRLPGAIIGGALKQDLMANEGDVVSFDWNYLTSDCYNYDLCFVLYQIDDLLFIHKLAGNSLDADIHPELIPLHPSNTIFENETGFNTFTMTLPVTGVYTLGVGVLAVEDEVYESGLVVDNFRIIPEPTTATLAALGLLGLVWRRRKG
jgi:hypothetical protein